MTQQEITNERAKIAVERASINCDIGEIDAKMLALQQQRNTLAAKITELNLRGADMLHRENDMRRAGTWETTK